MIETEILAFLAPRLEVPVHLTVPTPAPGAFVVLEQTGSDEARGITTTTLAVQSYGPDARDHDGTLDAARLNQAVKAAMADADTLPQVVSCRLVTDYRFPDTTRKRPRYQAVFYISHY